MHNFGQILGKSNLKPSRVLAGPPVSVTGVVTGSVAEGDR
jgi:hypothetical protein